MAIAALITAVTPHPEGLLLALGPVPATTMCATDGTPFYSPPSTPGQPTLILVNPTWTPLVGDNIWGCSGSIEINSGDIPFPYRRQGHRIFQNW